MILTRKDTEILRSRLEKLASTENTLYAPLLKILLDPKVAEKLEHLDKSIDELLKDLDDKQRKKLEKTLRYLAEKLPVIRDVHENPEKYPYIYETYLNHFLKTHLPDNEEYKDEIPVKEHIDEILDLLPVEISNDIYPFFSPRLVVKPGKKEREKIRKYHIHQVVQNIASFLEDKVELDSEKQTVRTRNIEIALPKRPMLYILLKEDYKEEAVKLLRKSVEESGVLEKIAGKECSEIETKDRSGGSHLELLFRFKDKKGKEKRGLFVTYDKTTDKLYVGVEIPVEIFGTSYIFRIHYLYIDPSFIKKVGGLLRARSFKDLYKVYERLEKKLVESINNLHKQLEEIVETAVLNGFQPSSSVIYVYDENFLRFKRKSSDLEEEIVVHFKTDGNKIEYTEVSARIDIHPIRLDKEDYEELKSISFPSASLQRIERDLVLYYSQKKIENITDAVKSAAARIDIFEEEYKKMLKEKEDMKKKLRLTTEDYVAIYLLKQAEEKLLSKQIGRKITGIYGAIARLLKKVSPNYYKKIRWQKGFTSIYSSEIIYELIDKGYITFKNSKIFINGKPLEKILARIPPGDKQVEKEVLEHLVFVLKNTGREPLEKIVRRGIDPDTAASILAKYPYTLSVDEVAKFWDKLSRETREKFIQHIGPEQACRALIKHYDKFKEYSDILEKTVLKSMKPSYITMLLHKLHPEKLGPLALSKVVIDNRIWAMSGDTMLYAFDLGDFLVQAIEYNGEIRYVFYDKKEKIGIMAESRDPLEAYREMKETYKEVLEKLKLLHDMVYTDMLFSPKPKVAVLNLSEGLGRIQKSSYTFPIIVIREGEIRTEHPVSSSILDKAFEHLQRKQEETEKIQT